MTKFVITLEVEMDTNETVDGVGLRNPSDWNYGALLSAGGYHVSASVADAYEACCESFVEWVTDAPDDRYPSAFQPYFHDEECAHFVGIEDEDGDEEVASTFTTVFGDVNTILGGLTIRPNATEVK